MKLKTNFMGFDLDHPIGNGAGTCRTMKQVEALARSAVSFVVIGSITKSPRETNKGAIYHFEDDLCSLNSIGMGNPGAEWYFDQGHLAEMVRVLHEAKKVVVLNIAGDTPEEYAYLAEGGFKAGVDIVEANFGCPNVIDGGKHKQVISYNLPRIETMIRAIQVKVGEEAKVAVKFSPYNDSYSIVQVAELVTKYPVAKAIVTMNTVPNGFLLGESGEPVITVPGSKGLAGTAGPAIRTTANGQVRQFATLEEPLPSRVQLVGVGGISEGWHVLERLKLGATVVQVATAYIQEEEGVFSRLLTEIADRVDVET